jgi:hypothetical protein
MANDIRNLSVAVIERAITIKKKISMLEAELAALLGGAKAGPKGKAAKVVDEQDEDPAPKKARAQRTMSPEGRARIIAAQKARWAKAKAGAKK